MTTRHNTSKHTTFDYDPYITRVSNNRGHKLIYVPTKQLLEFLHKEQLMEAIGRDYNRTAFKRWCKKNRLKGEVKDKFGNLLPNTSASKGSYNLQTLTTPILHVSDRIYNIKQLMNNFFEANWYKIENILKDRFNYRKNTVDGETPNGYGQYSKLKRATAHIDTRTLVPCFFMPYELTPTDAMRLQEEINRVLDNFKPTKFKSRTHHSDYWRSLAERAFRRWWGFELKSKEGLYRMDWQPVEKEEQ